MSYSSLGVRRVINACGIYTDLGGSVLSGAAWEAAVEANATWAAMDELLDRSGERIAALCGCEAARVVPGVSAGLALALGACVARGDGPAMEALPAVESVVLMQRGHEYAWARMAALAGARVEWVDDIAAALARGGAAAVLHPAHLDSTALGIEAVAALAGAADVPVVVDAAYMTFPLPELARWSTAADIACFSAKYFWGPNAGGFVAGREAVVAHVAALDFTGFESGFKTFGRAWKLDRATVAATVAALEAWQGADHDARLAGYAELARALAARLGTLPGASVELRGFTLDERLVDGPINAVVLRGGGDLTGELAARDPSVRAMFMTDAVVFCTEALSAPEVPQVADAMSAVWPN